MTSRVEAVADVLARELGYHRTQMIRLAEDVIEANDAWLKQSFQLAIAAGTNQTTPELYQCDRCGTRNDLGDECRGCGEPSP